MANYNLFKNIDTSSITSATSSLRQKLSSSQSKLNSFNSSLSDGMWKAPSKATLKEAFGKINDEVYKEITQSLEALDTAAGIISRYNDAKTAAETLKGYISNATDETSEASISSWKSELSIKEGIMEECERQINGLK